MLILRIIDNHAVIVINSLRQYDQYVSNLLMKRNRTQMPGSCLQTYESPLRHNKGLSHLRNRFFLACRCYMDNYIIIQTENALKFSTVIGFA